MHTYSLSFVIHALPFWFLVLSLFLPRISLVVLWLQSQTGPYHVVGLIPLIAAVLVPRLLILFMIYNDQGVTGWFLLHAIALLVAWGGFGGSQLRRRRDDV